VKVLLDDRLLIEELLVGIKVPELQLYTTSYWYYRACRAAVLGARGHLSGPFRELAPREQAQAITAMLRLSDDIDIPTARQLVPVMVEVSERHPKLNILNVEAVAASLFIGGTTWLAPEAANGILPSVLDREGLQWTVVTPADPR
jgi:hypothetical protein